MSLQDDLYAFVRAEFAETTGMPMPGDDEPLLSSAGGVVDSLGLQKLILFLEEDLGVEVLDEDIQPENFETLSALFAYAESHATLPGKDAPSPTETGG